MLVRLLTLLFQPLSMIVLAQWITSCLFAQAAPSQQTPSHSAASLKSREAEVLLGSQTAKGGFQNEDEIRDKLNNWRTDSDGQNWLKAMDFRIDEIEEVKADKPHGEKADVVLRITTKSAEKIEGISIKLVSNPQGLNQIDKRWLKTYAQMWQMPEEVYSALKLFVGEVTPNKPGRDSRRMFLNELSESQRRAIVNFFITNREQIVADLIAGDGEHSANWMMVTHKIGNTMGNATRESSTATSAQAESKPRWLLCSTADAAKFFGSGEVRITQAGNLKIGRITMQRKGGDNGRETAKMLQFKVNPAELFELRK